MMLPSKTLLLALPFAGGNSYSYSFLKLLLPAQVHFETLEYPGRGAKSREPLVNRMNLLLPQLVEQYTDVVNRVRPDKVVLYGHSIGTVVGTALLHMLACKPGLPVPSLAVFSGHGAPQITPKKQLSMLSATQLVAYFKSMGSMPDEVALNPELLDYILPILRNDLELYEQYEARFVEKLSIPLVIVNGKQDTVTAKEIAGWEHETTGEVQFYHLEGDHFFMRKYPEVFGALLSQQVQRVYSNYRKGQEATLA